VRASAKGLPGRKRCYTVGGQGALRWTRTASASGDYAPRKCACVHDKAWQLVEAGALQAHPPRQRTGRQSRLYLINT
jgi:hypothetical protein